VCAGTWVRILPPLCFGFNYFINQLKHMDLAFIIYWCIIHTKKGHSLVVVAGATGPKTHVFKPWQWHASVNIVLFPLLL